MELKRIRRAATAIATVAKAAHGDRLTVFRPLDERQYCRSSVLLSLPQFLPPSKLGHNPPPNKGGGGSGQPTPTDIKQALKAQ